MNEHRILSALNKEPLHPISYRTKAEAVAAAEALGFTSYIVREESRLKAETAKVQDENPNMDPGLARCLAQANPS